MTRTQLRGLPRQDLIEMARRPLRDNFLFVDHLVAELADRLEDCGRVDDYPFNSQPINHKDTNHEH